MSNWPEDYIPAFDQSDQQAHDEIVRLRALVDERDARLGEALSHVELLIPLARGYVAAHYGIESTQRIVADAALFLTAPDREVLTGVDGYWPVDRQVGFDAQGVLKLFVFHKQNTSGTDTPVRVTVTRMEESNGRNT